MTGNSGARDNLHKQIEDAIFWARQTYITEPWLPRAADAVLEIVQSAKSEPSE